MRGEALRGDTLIVLAILLAVAASTLDLTEVIQIPQPTFTIDNEGDTP